MRPVTSVSPDWYFFGVSPKCGPARLRGFEPPRIVDRRCVGQRHDRSDRRCRHQKPRLCVRCAPSACRLLKTLNSRSSTACAASSALAIDLEARMAGHQLADPCREAALRGLADLQPEAAQDPAQAVLDVQQLRLQPACGRVSTARVSCASIDLQCTGRNQPSRISWAIPRASLRSVFTGIALKASRTCRVSSSSTARPGLA